MKHFRKASANHRQWTQYPSFSLSAVNAVALAGDVPWKEAYGLILDQCERHGTLPEDRNCVQDMLRAAGYVRLKPSPKPKDYTALSDLLSGYRPAVSRALIHTARGQGLADQRICAVRRETAAADGFTVMDLQEEERRILYIWLPWREAGLPAPEFGEVTAVRVTARPGAHMGYMPFQPNPLQRSTGDCVIRAYSAVFGVSWSEALRMLARSCEYCTTELNSAHMYAYLTSEYGLEYHRRITESGRSLTGFEFCERMNGLCQDGERIFAKVGRSHVAAVIPVKEAGRTRYVLADSWDSTRELIGDYWIRRPRREKPPKPAEKAAETFTGSLSAGTELVHPVYGRGTVLSVDGEAGQATVSFPKTGEKLLSVSWIRGHCRQGVPGRKFRTE